MQIRENKDQWLMLEKCKISPAKISRDVYQIIYGKFIS